MGQGSRRCDGEVGEERVRVGNSDQKLLSILTLLEKCRTALLVGGHRDTAHLVSVAILEVRMRLNRIDDDELKALCDEMLADDGSARPRDPTARPGRRRRPLLRLVK